MLVGLAGAAAFGVGEGNQVVHEIHRPQPMAPHPLGVAGVVQPAVPGVEQQRIGRQPPAQHVGAGHFAAHHARRIPRFAQQRGNRRCDESAGNCIQRPQWRTIAEARARKRWI